MQVNVALTKLPLVLVLPVDCVYTSYIPANYMTFFETGAATIPVPLGAGAILIDTDPPLPEHLHGTV